MNLVQAEITDRKRAFARAKESIEESQRRWSNLTGKVLVPDTNVYLHHELEFPMVDWSAIALAAEGEPVQLVVPILVIDELDRAKRGRGEIRLRARRTLRALSDLFKDSDRPRFEAGKAVVDMHLLLDPPGHERLDDTDSELIDRTLALAAFAPAQPELITFDTGMAFRARATGLVVRHLTDE